jgi:hypothetical protein
MHCSTDKYVQSNGELPAVRRQLYYRYADANAVRSELRIPTTIQIAFGIRAFEHASTRQHQGI